MDYLPVNIAPKGEKQGDYFSPTDRPLRLLGHRVRLQAARRRHRGELPELKKIASRSAEPALAYATDEDTRGVDPDPLVEPLRPGQGPDRVRPAPGRS